MASKLYQLTFPDGSRKHIDREERDGLVLSNRARMTAPGKYLYTGPMHRFRTFADLAKLQTMELSGMRRRLPGNFLVEEADGQRHIETLETPEGLIERLVRSRQLVLQS